MSEEIKKVELPKDNSTHENTIEWWYFNGHLKDKKGKEYSFMDCFFKVDITNVNITHLFNNPFKNYYKKGNYIYFAHSVVSDILKQKNYKEIQNISMVSHDSFTRDRFFVNYINPNILGGFVNSEIEEHEDNTFHIKTGNLDLTLKPTKEPMLEGGHGYVGTIESGSYYYSLTNMETSGILMLDGKELEVTGKAWMDHQWADAVYKKDKWTWFSFQLENGMEIMCVEYKKKDGTDILINTLDKHGIQRQYTEATFKKGKKVWKSKKTKAEYPQVWEINIPEANILIKARSTMNDQEMIFGQINYWEGPLEVTVDIDGDKIKGKGFMELVGYSADYNYLLLESREIEEGIFKKVKNIFK